jgi:hypothetical protein
MWKRLALGLYLWAGPAFATEPVDLALVMAVDCSGSVDENEYRLQIDGIAAALRHPDIIAAIEAGPKGRVAINVMLWAGADEPRRKTGWHDLASKQDLEALAARVESLPFVTGGGTGLGAAVAESIAMLETSNIPASRQVIDVSGDGRESWKFEDPRMFLPQVKAILAPRSIIVNGLAITNNEPDLADYYRDNVIHGPAAFVIEAKTYDDFAKAMQVKLLRELQQNVARQNRPATQVTGLPIAPSD